MGMTCCHGSRRTFESVIERATDVVVAEFVARRPFGLRASEYEFIVHDRIIGNAADTIFVYIIYDEMQHRFVDPNLQFSTDTQYLLALIKDNNIYSTLHYDGFLFVNDLILDLNNPSRSTMHNQPLSLFSQMNFDSVGLTSEHIISYVRTLPNNPHHRVDRVFITTDNLRDIITGSPYVLVVEITEPISMSSDFPHRADIIFTDIYLTTVVEVLKGDLRVGDLVDIIFFGDTVFPGETHIVSVAPSSGSPYFQVFTSSHSLHSLDQRDEIMAIIRGPSRPATSSSATPTPSPTPEPSPTPTPTPVPVPAGPSRFSASPYDPDIPGTMRLENLSIDLPEDFVSAKLEIDELNGMFLQDEMHRLIANAGIFLAHSLISVYVGDLDLSDEQLLMFRGFEVNPNNGEYTIIPGSFSADRDYFYFEFMGSGIIGAIFYELPTPLLRLTINQYRYYYRGTQQTSDAAPFITQNRTMVPIRLVSEALGATPRWDRSNRTAYIYYNDTVLRLPVGEPLPDEMGTPMLRNNRVLVPLRFVIENFDAFTFWDRELREVTVYVLD